MNIDRRSKLLIGVVIISMALIVMGKFLGGLVSVIGLIIGAVGVYGIVFCEIRESEKWSKEHEASYPLWDAISLIMIGTLIFFSMGMMWSLTVLL